MSWTESFLEIATTVSLIAILASFALVVTRLVRGPSLPDRILALDMMVTVGVGFIAVIAVRTEQNTYVDVAIALGLVGFLATVAFSRYVIRRGLFDELDSGKNLSPTQQARTGTEGDPS